MKLKIKLFIPFTAITLKEAAYMLKYHNGYWDGDLEALVLEIEDE